MVELKAETPFAGLLPVEFGGVVLEEVDLDRRPASFLYQDQALYTFMDSENYEQYETEISSNFSIFPFESSTK